MDEPKAHPADLYSSSFVAGEKFSEKLCRCSFQEVGLVLLGLAACWIGTGSVGLLAWPLRHSLVWLLLGWMVVLAWPGRWVLIVTQKTDLHPNSTPVPLPSSFWPQAAGITFLVVLFAADSHPVLNLLAVVVCAAGLACLHQGRLRRILTCLAWAGFVLGVHRLALLTIPSYWHLADWVGSFLGEVGGGWAGYPLEVGATFAGVDFLVLTGAWMVIWVVQTGWVKWRLSLSLLVLLCLAHFLYLGVLSLYPIWRSNLPPAPPRPEYHVYLPPPWTWSETLRSLLPWTLPWVGMGIHLSLLGLALRWIGWPNSYYPPEPIGTVPSTSIKGQSFPSPLKNILLETGPVILSLLWAIICLFWGASTNLSGKKILAYAPQPKEWTKPASDRYARSDLGRFGMLSELAVSLGAQWTFCTCLLYTSPSPRDS